MKPSSAYPPQPNRPPNSAPRSGRPVLALFFFLLGAALTAGWFEFGKASFGHHELGTGETGLPADVMDQLRHLNSPVELRIYSILPTDSASEALQKFSGRVDQLLSGFAAANAAQIRVIRHIATIETNADDATADGIQPFNLEKGDACFLGIAVVSGDRKESLARLRPEWEPALPFDLAQAILQVATAPPPAPPKSVPIPPGITNEIVRLIPDIKSISPADADAIFHDDFLKQCATVSAEMETQINAAQQQVLKAQASGSAADLQAAQKHLSDVQLEQAEKFKEIAAHLQLQLAVFQRMKAAATNSTP